MGAKMAIVYDNVDEVSESIIITEDGHGDRLKHRFLYLLYWLQLLL